MRFGTCSATVLRGVDGSRHVVVNNSGREIEILPDEVKPIPGRTPYNSTWICRAAEDFTGDQVGAVVAWTRVRRNPGPGRHHLDPNHFASGITSFDSRLPDNPDHPFENGLAGRRADPFKIIAPRQL
jgi:hypothetical protein